MDIDQVLPQLCVGQSPKTVEDLDMLNHEYGITAVLCLQTDGEIGKATLGWDRMEAYYRNSGMDIRRVPVPGDPDSLRTSLPKCVEVLDGLLRGGHKVYVHCDLGMTRAPTAVVAYLHWVQDWGFEEAIDYVTACRACEPRVKVLQLANADWRKDPSGSGNPVSV